jgi:hypothetical protein
MARSFDFGGTPSYSNNGFASGTGNQNPRMERDNYLHNQAAVAEGSGFGNGKYAESPVLWQNHAGSKFRQAVVDAASYGFHHVPVHMDPASFGFHAGSMAMPGANHAVYPSNQFMAEPALPREPVYSDAFPYGTASGPDPAYYAGADPTFSAIHSPDTMFPPLPGALESVDVTAYSAGWVTSPTPSADAASIQSVASGPERMTPHTIPSATPPSERIRSPEESPSRDSITLSPAQPAATCESACDPRYNYGYRVYCCIRCHHILHAPVAGSVTQRAAQSPFSATGMIPAPIEPKVRPGPLSHFPVYTKSLLTAAAATDHRADRTGQGRPGYPAARSAASSMANGRVSSLGSSIVRAPGYGEGP